MTEEKKAPAKKTAAKKTAAPKAPAKPKAPKAAQEEVTPLIGAVTPPASAPKVNQAPAKKQGFFSKLFGKKS